MITKILFVITAGGFLISNKNLDAIHIQPIKHKLVIESPILVAPAKKFEPYDWQQELVDGIKHFEGFYADTYTCCGGVKTIGWGHTGKYVRSGHISKEKAHNILLEDLRKYESKVLSIVEVPLSQNQLAALTSFTFNCGEGALKTLVTGKDRLNSGNYESINRILPLYRKAGGKIRKGLVRRRAWELELWNQEELYLVKE